jgi:S1-C subfamily serine protease
MSTPSLTTLSAEIAAIAKQASPSIVAIQSRGRPFSGFLWHPDVVVTASDRLRARTGQTVAVLTSERPEAVEGTVIGHDPTTDVALIRLPTTGRPIAAEAASPSLGEIVIVSGRTVHGATCAVGHVALAEGPWRSMRGGDISRQFWLDIALSWRSEGGAVFDASGQFVGMPVFGPRRRVLVIPVETIGRAGEELLAHGRIRRGYLGVGIQPVAVAPKAGVETAEGKAGLMVMSLDPKGPVAQAGLQQGDVIVAVDGTAVGSRRALARLLPGASIGRALAVDILRAGQSLTLQVTVGEAPASRACSPQSRAAATRQSSSLS